MIGKIKNLNFTALFFLISLSLIVNSYIFGNFLLVSFFLTFFLISILLTKYGLKIINKFNLLQSIRNEGPSSHLRKKNTPTMGGIFIIIPFLLLLLFINNQLESASLSLLFFNIIWEKWNTTSWNISMASPNINFPDKCNGSYKAEWKINILNIYIF